MNVAIKLTLLRMILTIPFIVSCLLEEGSLKFISLILFSIASLTDYLDGRIARAKNIITDAGKILDPIADKILITGAFVSFVQLGKVPAWIAIVIISREFLVTGLRTLAANKNVIIAASSFGKAKMFLQTIAVFLILLGFNEIINLLVLWATAIITILSGLDYFIKNRNIIKEALK
ncbi:MAG: CDP-diacylglycerol--glycerol-3-phosphate 3-phosphatidyltransferase [Synergistetes bacterium]|nr:CDP-diacylglycerol--glycerol-3-phosphate 3-phosphatidyltransferase [Synergistota bacterium]MCX8127558.1 CDP-diacylglycerol--glycerol-3-phosphate 3-phosphatidyltransferase [Synergistota bacterium]MDW8191525.1 CDP-diacylglycerol--glycerol-3-phosphate 3-phosphatidyltransferase [Synergistota bacterium]